MFAGGAAAEVVAGQKDRRTIVTGLIQEERRVRRAVLLPPPVKKQAFTEAGPFDRLEKLFWNNLIGIDIDPVQWCHEAGQLVGQ